MSHVILRKTKNTRENNLLFYSAPLRLHSSLTKFNGFPSNAVHLFISQRADQMEKRQDAHKFHFDAMWRDLASTVEQRQIGRFHPTPTLWCTDVVQGFLCFPCGVGGTMVSSIQFTAERTERVLFRARCTGSKKEMTFLKKTPEFSLPCWFCVILCHLAVGIAGAGMVRCRAQAQFTCPIYTLC